MNTSSKNYMSFNSSSSSLPPLAESTAIGMAMSQQDGIRGNQKRKTTSPLMNTSKQRQIMPIEPHILQNSQSRGLVKRLVTYYDESQGESDKNRYVYNRVGDFPIVQLKKTEIKRNLVRTSSVRIAPPSRIVNRDVRAAILRSNSIQFGSNVPKLLPTKMRAKEDDLHQIITNHDPLPSHDSPQTAKSVLDALEKNCRKRINNEELTLDRNKRICATTTQQEVVDAPSREFAPIAQQSVKRGREDSSPTKSNNESQLRKKLRLKNNALLSSLSSSQYLLQPAASTAVHLPEKIAPTPAETSKEVDVEQQTNKLKQVTISSAENRETQSLQPAKRLHLFNAKVDPSKFRRIVDDDDKPVYNFVKPREKTQGSNSDYLREMEKKKLAIMLAGLSDGFDSPTKEYPNDFVDSAPASISFTTSTTTSAAAPITTPASQANTLPSFGINSKSAFSLSPIEAKDKPADSTAPTTTETPKSNFQFGSVITTPVPVAATPVVTTSPAPSGRISPLALFTTPGEVQPTAKPMFDPSKSLITFTPIAKNPIASSADVTSSASTFTTSVAPALTVTTGGFTLEASKEPAKPMPNFSFSSTTSTPAFGAAFPSATTIASTTVASLLTTTAAPSFSFPSAASTAISFGPKPAEIIAAAPTPANSFGAAGNLNRTMSFMSKPETTVASGIGFSFNNNSTAQPTTTSAPAFNSVANQPLVFGSNNAAPTPVTTTNSFNFGSNSSSFGQPTAAPSTVFPSFAAPKPDAQPASDMFSFGQKPAIPATTTAAQSFSFGGPAQPTTTQAPAFGFGQQSNSMQTAVTTTNTQPGIFSRLGEKPAEAAKAFSFGGNIQQQQQQQQQPSVPSIFGANAAPAPTSSFGSVNPAGSSIFNQAPATNMFGANQNQSNDFGGAAKPSSGSMFGGFNNQSSNNQQSVQQSVQQSPSGMFNFGSNTAAPAAAPSVFGSSSSQTVNASFNFKTATGVASSNSTPSVFGQNQFPSPAAPPAYQFNNANSNISSSSNPNQFIGNNVSATHTFGGSSTSTPLAAPSNGFNFGGGAQSAPVAGSGFNFQQQQPSLTPQPSPGGGLFSIGTGGNNQQRRPMRQATRRMK